MRNVIMFVVGFALVAVAGVAVAQPGLFTPAQEGVPVVESPEPVPVAQLPTADDVTETTGTPDTPVDDVEPTIDRERDERPAVDGVRLVVLHPVDGQHVDRLEVAFEGKTTPGAKVWSGDHLADVGEDGSWRMVLPLRRGRNVVYVGAALGDSIVTREVTVWAGAALEWRIEQTVKASEKPYERFVGTGSPGMRITATSAYGSNSTVIGESGEWSLGIEFSSTPGTTFPITVTTSTGWIEHYRFTHIGPEKDQRPWSIEQGRAESHQRYAVFWGTGPVGTTVVARSEYGSADTVVGEHGEWELKVRLESPAGAAVPIRVTSSLGFEGTYRFTWLGYEFTAKQAFGEHDARWEKFGGTGAPGTLVTATSPYGSGSTEIGPYGEWDLKVEFPDAPAGVRFDVTISTDTGIQRTFGFVYLEPVYDFSVEQSYGSCSETPPYDVFVGTGRPGSVVEIGSAYGGARVEVGDAGKWEAKVVFEGAPVGVPFEVVVADSDGHSRTFTFTRLAAG